MAWAFRGSSDRWLGPHERQQEERLDALESTLSASLRAQPRVFSWSTFAPECWPSASAAPLALYWDDATASTSYSYGGEAHNSNYANAHPAPVSRDGFQPLIPGFVPRHWDDYIRDRTAVAGVVNWDTAPCVWHSMIPYFTVEGAQQYDPDNAPSGIEASYIRDIVGTIQFYTVWGRNNLSATAAAGEAGALQQMRPQRVRMFVVEVDRYKEIELVSLIKQASEDAPLTFHPGSCPNVAELFSIVSHRNGGVWNLQSATGTSTVSKNFSSTMADCWAPETFDSPFRSSYDYEAGTPTSVTELVNAAPFKFVTTSHPFPVAVYRHGDAYVQTSPSMRQFKILWDRSFTIPYPTQDTIRTQPSVTSNGSITSFFDVDVKIPIRRNDRFPVVWAYDDELGGAIEPYVMPRRYIRYLCIMTEQGFIQRLPRTSGEVWSTAAGLPRGDPGGSFSQLPTDVGDETNSAFVTGSNVSWLTNASSSTGVPGTQTYLRGDLRIETATEPRAPINVEAEFSPQNLVDERSIGRSRVPRGRGHVSGAPMNAAAGVGETSLTFGQAVGPLSQFMPAPYGAYMRGTAGILDLLGRWNPRRYLNRGMHAGVYRQNEGEL